MGNQALNQFSRGILQVRHVDSNFCRLTTIWGNVLPPPRDAGVVHVVDGHRRGRATSGRRNLQLSEFVPRICCCRNLFGVLTRRVIEHLAIFDGTGVCCGTVTFLAVVLLLLVVLLWPLGLCRRLARMLTWRLRRLLLLALLGLLWRVLLRRLVVRVSAPWSFGVGGWRFGSRGFACRAGVAAHLVEAAGHLAGRVVVRPVGRRNCRSKPRSIDLAVADCRPDNREWTMVAREVGIGIRRRRSCRQWVPVAPSGPQRQSGQSKSHCRAWCGRWRPSPRRRRESQ